MIGRLALRVGCTRKVKCIIGVNPIERIQPQVIKIKIEALADVSKACQSDNLEDTISYSDLGKICEQVAIDGKYLLMEKLAYEIVQRVNSKFPQISKYHVYIEKNYNGKKYFIKLDV